jgi:hypothetical protein
MSQINQGLLFQIIRVLDERGHGYSMHEDGEDILFECRLGGVLLSRMGCAASDIEKRGLPFVESLLRDLATLADGCTSAIPNMIACPFCGAFPDIKHRYDEYKTEDIFGGCWLECCGCSCVLGMLGSDSQENERGEFASHQQAADAWNKRAS